MEKQKREVVVIEIEIRRRKKKHWNLPLSTKEHATWSGDSFGASNIVDGA